MEGKMIDHISLRVSDFQRSRAFYEAALAPLGYTLVFTNDQEQYAGFAGPDRERIWIGRHDGPRGYVGGYVHIAILSRDRATVRRFYDEAMKAGGRDNGAPATRPQYSPTYYGAFVLDPDGHNIEAVCFEKGE
jgi:catechol 2,3-dioxygenase-like lactoylglutathione lyase family enzyme